MAPSFARGQWDYSVCACSLAPLAARHHTLEFPGSQASLVSLRLGTGTFYSTCKLPSQARAPLGLVK